MKIDALMEQYGLAATGSGEAATVRNADAATTGDNQTASGDAVDISEEGRSLAVKMGELKESGSDSGEKQGDAVSVESDEDSEESSISEITIKRIRDRMKELQEQLKEVQDDKSLTEKQKQQKIQEINQELSELAEELAKQTGAKFNGAIQGTRAEGFGSSLT